MVRSPTFRGIIVCSLLASCGGMIALTCFLLWPAWRERTIERALRDSSGQSIWWPPSWRKEYATVQDLIDAINDDKKIANFGTALKSVEEAHLESKAVPGLVRAMQSPKGNPRTMAAQALANLDVSEQVDTVLPVLIDSLSHPWDGVRSNTVLAIEKLGPKAKPAIPKLIELLNTASEPGVRSNAVGALTQIGLDEDDVLAALRYALRDNDATVRWNAAVGICRSDPTSRDALPVLIEAMKEGGWKHMFAGEAIRKIDAALFDQMMREMETQGIDSGDSARIGGSSSPP